VRAVRVGTRGSLLARTQTALIADRLAAAGFSITTEIIRTVGDDQTLELHRAPQPGVFVSALRDALLASQVDVIVHSLKDLPSESAEGIVLGAVPHREDPRDVLIASASLLELKAGAIVGTSSPRRTGFIGRERPDLVVRAIRGNIDTRIAKVRSGEFDAVILAAAGLARIGRSNDVTEFFAADRCIPAPAQGALGVECRAEDAELIEALSDLIDAKTWWDVHAERAVLTGVNATCATAVGANVINGVLHADLFTEHGYLRTTVPCDQFEWAHDAGLAAATALRSDA
jgi:hydroxymethylbilane synthase